MHLKTDDGVKPAIIVPTKQGSLYVLDRRDGTPIVPIREIPTPQGAVKGDHTSPTQARSDLNLLGPELTEQAMWGATPFDQMLCRIQFRELRYEGQYTPPSEQGSLVYPGNVGVFNWGSVSVDPVRQLLFTSPNYMAFVSKMVPREQVAEGSKRESETSGVQPNTGAPYAVTMHPFMSPLGCRARPRPGATWPPSTCSPTKSCGSTRTAPPVTAHPCRSACRLACPAWVARS